MKSGRNFSGYCRGPYVFAPRVDEGVDLVRPHVCEHLKISTCLGRAVRARRPDRGILRARGCVERDVAVHLVGRDVQEAKPVVPGVIEQDLRAEDVREDEFGRPEDRPVDVRLRGEVHDCLAAGGRARDGLGVGDVPLVELVVDAVEIRPVARVRQLVEHDDGVATRSYAPCEVRADEAGAACNQHPHRAKVIDGVSSSFASCPRSVCPSAAAGASISFLRRSSGS